MRIYIDEAGSFLPPSTPRSSFSLVLAHIVPSAFEKELFFEFLRLRDSWPMRKVEVKGSKLNESQASQLISLVNRYDTLVIFSGLDSNMHSQAVISEFKNRQADAVTANITREHHPGPIPHYHQLGESVRSMSNQLFLQVVATWELIIRTIREATLYFVQRRPEELGDVAWIVDRKDRTLTEMEETWSTLILPMSENTFAKEPFACIQGEDYSHFENRYGFTTATADPEMLRHIEWTRSAYGIAPGEDRRGIDAKKLLSEQLVFDDSRSSVGLQLADMLASILRRAFNNKLQISGWKNFGSLLIRHHNPGTGLIQLGPGAETALRGHAKEVCVILHRCAKDMLVQRNRQ